MNLNDLIKIVRKVYKCNRKQAIKHIYENRKVLKDKCKIDLK